MTDQFEQVSIGECQEDLITKIGQGSAIFAAILMTLFSLQGIAWWRKSNRQDSQKNIVQMLLLFSIAIAIIGALSLFVEIQIRIWFLVSILNSYLVLVALSTVVRYLNHNTAESMRQKMKYVLIPLHLMFIFVGVLGLLISLQNSAEKGDSMHYLGAKCFSDEANLLGVFPIIFAAKDLLFSLLVVVLLVFACRQYCINWEDKGQYQIREGSTLLTKHETVFKSQAKRLVIYGTCFFILIAAQQSLMFWLIRSNKVSCSENGHQFKFESCFEASLVQIVTSLVTIFGSFTARVVFIKNTTLLNQKLTASSLCSDYKRGLALHPDSFSSDEDDEPPASDFQIKRQRSNRGSLKGSQRDSQEFHGIVQTTSQNQLETEGPLQTDRIMDLNSDRKLNVQPIVDPKKRMAKELSAHIWTNNKKPRQKNQQKGVQKTKQQSDHTKQASALQPVIQQSFGGNQHQKPNQNEQIELQSKQRQQFQNESEQQQIPWPPKHTIMMQPVQFDDDEVMNGGNITSPTQIGFEQKDPNRNIQLPKKAEKKPWQQEQGHNPSNRRSSEQSGYPSPMGRQTPDSTASNPRILIQQKNTEDTDLRILENQYARNYEFNVKNVPNKLFQAYQEDEDEEEIYPQESRQNSNNIHNLNRHETASFSHNDDPHNRTENNNPSQNLNQTNSEWLSIDGDQPTYMNLEGQSQHIGALSQIDVRGSLSQKPTNPQQESSQVVDRYMNNRSSSVRSKGGTKIDLNKVFSEFKEKQASQSKTRGEFAALRPSDPVSNESNALDNLNNNSLENRGIDRDDLYNEGLEPIHLQDQNRTEMIGGDGGKQKRLDEMKMSDLVDKKANQGFGTDFDHQSSNPQLLTEKSPSPVDLNQNQNVYTHQRGKSDLENPFVVNTQNQTMSPSDYKHHQIQKMNSHLEQQNLDIGDLKITAETKPKRVRTERNLLGDQKDKNIQYKNEEQNALTPVSNNGPSPITHGDQKTISNASMDQFFIENLPKDNHQKTQEHRVFEYQQNSSQQGRMKHEKKASKHGKYFDFDSEDQMKREQDRKRQQFAISEIQVQLENVKTVHRQEGGFAKNNDAETSDIMSSMYTESEKPKIQLRQLGKQSVIENTNFDGLDFDQTQNGATYNVEQELKMTKRQTMPGLKSPDKQKELFMLAAADQQSNLRNSQCHEDVKQNPNGGSQRPSTYSKRETSKFKQLSPNDKQKKGSPKTPQSPFKLGSPNQGGSNNQHGRKMSYGEFSAITQQHQNDGDGSFMSDVRKLRGPAPQKPFQGVAQQGVVDIFIGPEDVQDPIASQKIKKDQELRAKMLLEASSQNNDRNSHSSKVLSATGAADAIPEVGGLRKKLVFKNQTRQAMQKAKEMNSYQNQVVRNILKKERSGKGGVQKNVTFKDTQQYRVQGGKGASTFMIGTGTRTQAALEKVEKEKQIQMLQENPDAEIQKPHLLEEDSSDFNHEFEPKTQLQQRDKGDHVLVNRYRGGENSQAVTSSTQQGKGATTGRNVLQRQQQQQQVKENAVIQNNNKGGMLFEQQNNNNHAQKEEEKDELAMSQEIHKIQMKRNKLNLKKAQEERERRRRERILDDQSQPLQKNISASEIQMTSEGNEIDLPVPFKNPYAE